MQGLAALRAAGVGSCIANTFFVRWKTAWHWRGGRELHIPAPGSRHAPLLEGEGQVLPSPPRRLLEAACCQPRRGLWWDGTRHRHCLPAPSRAEGRRGAVPRSGSVLGGLRAGLAPGTPLSSACRSLPWSVPTGSFPGAEQVHSPRERSLPLAPNPANPAVASRGTFRWS